jgi:hypothetical protein
MPGEFFSLIPGDAVLDDVRQGQHFPGEQSGDPISIPVIRDPDRHRETNRSFRKRRDLRCVALSDDEIALPETGDSAVVVLLGPLTEC